jgi:competence protein ComEC
MLFAVACWCGALSSVSAPMVVGYVVLVGALLMRDRGLLLVGGFVAAAVFAANAHGGLQPLSPQEFSGRVTLLDNPQEIPDRLTVDVSSDVGRLRLEANGESALAIQKFDAGARLTVNGTLRPLARPERVRSRHLRMSLVATEVVDVHAVPLWRLPVDGARNIVERGASVLPASQRPVYSGFVIGDDRGSDPEVNRTFEESGLSHLLVVSGQNVVFILAVMAPLTQRLGRRTQMVVLIAIILFFAAVTRFEPSILRASVMAMIAIVASRSGHLIRPFHRLALAVSLLVLIDPLLVYSFGFRLSLAATAGIALLATRCEKALRGPQWFRNVLSVTIAAQAGVAPLVIPAFGPMPLASLPANVLAGPIAGFVMMWGSSVGLLAGVIGGWPAFVLQLPVRLGLWWIMSVAEQCSRLPLPDVGAESLVIFGAAVAVIFSFRRLRVRRRYGRWSPPESG